jgi:hypothetical protein
MALSLSVDLHMEGFITPALAWDADATPGSRACQLSAPRADLRQTATVLIKSYGEFWNPDTVDWSADKLLGTRPDPQNPKVQRQNNFWKAKGIYVLHAEFKPVYVGKALGQNSGLGQRIEAHLTDRLVARWDSFSWFSVSRPSAAGGVNQGGGGGRHFTRGDVVNSLEALAILIADPPLNRRRESLAGAEEITQSVGSIRSIRSYLEEVLRRLPNPSATDST